MQQSPMPQDQQVPMRITSSNVEQIVDVTIDQQAAIPISSEVHGSKEGQELAFSAGTSPSIATIGTVLTVSQEQKEQAAKSQRVSESTGQNTIARHESEQSMIQNEIR